MAGDADGMQVKRLFEQPDTAIAFYSDYAQVVGTGNEVVIQFYETIPGPPGPGGQMQVVRTRLKATITVSLTQSTVIGNLLTQHAKVTAQSVPPVSQGKGPQS